MLVYDLHCSLRLQPQPNCTSSSKCAPVSCRCPQNVLQGLTNIGNIVVVMLALIITSPLNDWWIVWMARHNRGVYEPEFRLPFTLSMLFGVFGYVGWAIGNDRNMPWIGAVACLAYVLPSLPFLSSASISPHLPDHLFHGATTYMTSDSPPPPSPSTCTTG